VRTVRRVLQVVTLSEWGGAQKVVYDLATGLSRERFETEVACAPGGPLADGLRGRGVTVHGIPALRREPAPFSDLKALWDLCRLMRRGRYDIVHCHSSKAGLLGRLAARVAGVRRIFFTVHGWGFENRREFGILPAFLTGAERLAARVTAALVCVSRATWEEGIQRRIASPEKLLVIYNGLDPPPPAGGEALRRMARAGPGDLLVVTAGRLAPQKQPLAFLQAAAKIAAVEPRARFVMIGDGPLENACRDFIARAGLEDRVHLAGFHPDVPALLPGADVFVLLSAFEGLPLVVIEAMAAGLPVVAYAVGGLPEQVADGETGFLVEPDDSDGAVERILRLLGDERLREDMGSRGRERARERFGREAMVRAYQDLYEREG